MSALGKQIRLNRIFSHPSGRILAVAADHMINYSIGMPEGLRRIGDTVRRIIEARPSSITLNKGVAARCMGELAGRVPLIIQQMAPRPGCDGFADHAEVEEAVAMGADAIAVAMFVKDPGEFEFLKRLSKTVREAERWRKAALAADEESARLREELARRPAPPSSLPSPARRNRRRGVTA